MYTNLEKKYIFMYIWLSAKKQSMEKIPSVEALNLEFILKKDYIYKYVNLSFE